jgi:hypothetical protein
MKLRRSDMFRWVLVVLFSAAISLPFLSAEAQNQPQKTHGAGMSAVPPTENVFPPMPASGKRVPLEEGSYFVYGFDKKPKLGTVIMKVEIFAKDGKKVTSYEVKGDCGMPSMRGAHDTGDRAFKVSKNGDYLLPIDIVMPGGWEVRLTVLKDGKVVFRGSHPFDV